MNRGLNVKLSAHVGVGEGGSWFCIQLVDFCTTEQLLVDPSLFNLIFVQAYKVEVIKDCSEEEGDEGRKKENDFADVQLLKYNYMNNP